jgi:hypothetical protein
MIPRLWRTQVATLSNITWLLVHGTTDIFKRFTNVINYIYVFFQSTTTPPLFNYIVIVQIRQGHLRENQKERYLSNLIICIQIYVSQEINSKARSGPLNLQHTKRFVLRGQYFNVQLPVVPVDCWCATTPQFYKRHFIQSQIRLFIIILNNPLNTVRNSINYIYKTKNIIL